MPGLPGATNSVVSNGLFASAMAMACSRPPEPRRSTFMIESFEAAYSRDDTRSCAMPLQICTLAAATLAAKADLPTTFEIFFFRLLVFIGSNQVKHDERETITLRIDLLK